MVLAMLPGYYYYLSIGQLTSGPVKLNMQLKADDILRYSNLQVAQPWLDTRVVPSDPWRIVGTFSAPILGESLGLSSLRPWRIVKTRLGRL